MPIGFSSLEKKRFTNASLTIATGAVVSLSASVNARPRTIVMPRFCR